MNKSAIMKRAARYREEGMSPRQALIKAWRNPSETTFKPSGLTTLLVLGGGGLLVYRLVAKKWPWSPSTVELRRNNR